MENLFSSNRISYTSDKSEIGKTWIKLDEAQFFFITQLYYSSVDSACKTNHKIYVCELSSEFLQSWHSI